MSVSKKNTDYLDNQIISYLKVHKQIRTAEALKIFPASRMTLYRAFKRLETKGYLEPEHGKVYLNPAIEIEPDFVSKTIINIKLKDKIARWAVEEFVSEGTIVALESGTTVASCISYLKSKRPGSLLSNGINVVQLAAAESLPDTDIYCSGGKLRRQSMSFIGSEAQRFFSVHHADIAFVGASAIDPKLGIMDTEIEIKRQICDNASRSILLADSSKFGKRSLLRFGDLSSVDTIVTDSQINPEVATQIQQMNGVKFFIV